MRRFIQLHLTLGVVRTAPRRRRPIRPARQTPETINSPGVGVVLYAHPAHAGSAPTLPRKAAKGDIVAYIKTGLTLRAVPATNDCHLRRALAAEGTGIGYGDALFDIAP